MDTLLCNDDGDIVIGTYDPSNTLLRLSADQYTSGSATWTDQSGNGLDFTVSTNASLKGTDADGFPYMNFSGSYGIAKRIVGSSLTNIPAPTTGKYTIFCVTQILNSTSTWRTLIRGSSRHPIIVQTGNNNLGLWNGAFRDSGFDVTTAMTSSRNLLTWELSTTTPYYNFQLNESGTNSTVTSAVDLPFSCVGGYHNVSTVITTSSQYWGNIYEFIVYDGVLGASERDYVAEYLAYKWDISSKLPSLTSTHGVTTLENIGALDVLGSSVYTSVDAAYSLRRLFLAYTGPQVRVRRSTDDAETDVYFSSDGSTQNLTTWLGGATAYVTTWYDQSGDTKHLRQTTTSLQPQLQLDGSKYKIYFNGSNVLEHPDDPIFNSVEQTIVARSKSTGTMNDWMSYVTKISPSSSSGRFFALWYESNHRRMLYQRYGTTSETLVYDIGSGGHLNVTRTVVCRTNSSSTMSYYVDGALRDTGSGSFTPNTGPFLVGGSTVIHQRFLGYIENVMVYTSALDDATSEILSYPATLL